MKEFSAPWSKSLIFSSTLATVFCLGIALGLGKFLSARSGHPPAPAAIFWLPLAFVAGCALFTIRGYAVTPDSILVHRLLWSTRIPRAGLQSASCKPGVMRWSIRTWGNGGLFAFSGFFWNKTLGSYRAYVTDQRRPVILCYETSTIILSPGDPEEFIRYILGNGSQSDE